MSSTILSESEIDPSILFSRPRNGGDLYLDLELIKPGDVLLSRGRKPASTAIAYATKGPFSHAALVLDEYAIFEADSVGVGRTPLLRDRAEARDRGSHRLLSRLSGVRCAVVLRHPAEPPTDIAELLANATAPFWGMQYPLLV